MTINILLLTSSTNVSGPIKGVLQLVENVKDSSFKYYLYGFRHNNEKDTLFIQAMRERGVPLYLLSQRGRSYIPLVQLFLKEIKEKKIDVVQTHGFKPTFLGFFAKKFCRVKWICFMHGTTNENLKVRFYNLVDNVLQMAAHRTVLVSEAQRRHVYGGHNIKRIHVLHNAVDVDRPMPVSKDRLPVREIFELPDESKIVVTVGRFSPEKGMDILLHSFAMLLRQMDKAHLVLVGDGQERVALETQVQQLRIEKNIHFAGYSETPGDYLVDADAFVLPSRSEGIPNAVLEAMAIGKPVVASAVGGVPEIIEDGITGLLVPPERPDLLADVMVEVLSNNELSQQLAFEGKRRVQELFSIQARINKIRALYSDVLSKK